MLAFFIKYQLFQQFILLSDNFVQPLISYNLFRNNFSRLSNFYIF